jgi:predicted 2-oxoglutarate/Fe(II)-dependent dioxygenase YbiX
MARPSRVPGSATVYQVYPHRDNPAPRGARVSGPIFLQHGCLDAHTCELVRKAMDEAPQTPAEIFRDGYCVDETVRHSTEVEVDTATLNLLQQAIATLQPTLSLQFAVPIAGFEGVGLLRYRAGGLYRPHRDVLPATAGFAERRLSLVLFVTSSATNEGSAGEECCVGGALRVFTDDVGESYTDILPRAGTLVAFPATLLHEVRPVIAGVRDVAVDWAV